MRMFPSDVVSRLLDLGVLVEYTEFGVTRYKVSDGSIEKLKQGIRANR
jgi:hypothetical protein